MPIYKQTTEITNIDDLLSSVERDIEEVYFGDKQVFTVWAEYDGTLPAQYTANGSMLADYRIYGTAGGVGDDSGTAYGYEVPMKISHKEVLTSDDFQIGVYTIANGTFTPLPYYLCTQKHPLESSTLNAYIKLGKKTNAISITY